MRTGAVTQFFVTGFPDNFLTGKSAVVFFIVVIHASRHESITLPICLARRR
jgi:hypothetical protein